MDLENLDISPELREKAKACKTPEELLALAKKEGYKLSDEEMQAVSGGGWTCDDTCSNYKPYRYWGDAREGIDPSRAHADFVNGAVDGGEAE